MSVWKVMIIAAQGSGKFSVKFCVAANSCGATARV